MSPRPHANKFTSANAIFGILDWLDEHGTVTVGQVMAKVRCSDRQARDYLAFLEERGLVARKRRGRTDEYHGVEKGNRSGSIALAETTGVDFAVAVLGALQGTAFHSAAIDHIKQLRHDLGEREGPRAARLRSAFYAVRGSAPANTRHAENAEEILDALMHGNALKATYELVSNGEVREYNLWPLAIVVHHHDGLHLLARRTDTGRVRMFDVEGFLAVERVRGSVTPPPDLDMDEYFSGSFGRYADFPVKEVVLRLRGEAARQVRRRRFHPSQVITVDSDNEVHVHYQLGVCPEFTAWVLGLAPNAEVLGPPELREEVQKRHTEGATANARTG